MPAANWTITIRPGAGPNPPAQFDPPNLIISAGDIVAWANKTPNDLELEWIDENGNGVPIPTGGPIPSDDVSDAVTVDRSFQYRCDGQASATGSVTVAP